MGFRSLLAYKKAFELAMELYEKTKFFPKIEQYSMTDQIRRSSRSVCANIGEAYRRRKYPKHFQSKLSDSDSENTETQVWLDFALSCEYLNKEEYQYFCEKSEEVGKLIHFMIKNPHKFL